MQTKKSSRVQWEAVRTEVSRSRGSGARIPKGSIPHPRDAGARPTATFPVGQVADYALDSPSGPPLVVREFPDSFEAALDGVRTTARMMDAIEQQPSAAMYFGAALLGGAVGSSLSQKKEGALVGIGLGLLLAAALNSALDEPRRRR
jgi:hypothetical protein